MSSSSESSSESEDNMETKPQLHKRLHQNAAHGISDSESSETDSKRSQEISKTSSGFSQKSTNVLGTKVKLEEDNSESSSDSSDSDSTSDEKLRAVKIEPGILKTGAATKMAEDWDSASDFGVESKVAGIITSLESPVKQRKSLKSSLLTPAAVRDLQSGRHKASLPTPAFAHFSPLTTPLATAHSTSSSGASSSDGSSSSASEGDQSGDETVKRKLESELSAGESEADMFASPSKKMAGKSLFEIERPFSFECPDGFKEVEVAESPIWQENLVGKELWLIKAPIDFDANILSGSSPTKMQGVVGKGETKEGRAFSWKANTNRGKANRVNDFSVILPSKRSRQPKYAGEFSGEIHISKNFPAAHYTFPASTKVPPQIPTGLKLRYVPFGSGANSVNTTHRIKATDSTLSQSVDRKHKKKKRKHNEEDDVDSFIKDDGNMTMEVDDNDNMVLEESKKKKKKIDHIKEKVEIADRVNKDVDISLNLDSTLDCSSKIDGKKKKKKKKDKGESKYVVGDNLQNISSISMNDSDNNQVSEHFKKKKSKKHKKQRAE